MKKSDLEEIMMQIRENRLRLEKCTLHDFKPMTHRPGRYKCTYCKGETETSFVKGYYQGLEHNNIKDAVEGE